MMLDSVKLSVLPLRARTNLCPLKEGERIHHCYSSATFLGPFLVARGFDLYPV